LTLAFYFTGTCRAEDEEDATVDDDIGKSRDGSRTDDEAVQRYGSQFSLYKFKIWGPRPFHRIVNRLYINGVLLFTIKPKGMTTERVSSQE